MGGKMPWWVCLLAVLAAVGGNIVLSMAAYKWGFWDPRLALREDDYYGLSPDGRKVVVGLHGRRGWVSLFDGKTTSGWHSADGSKWVVADGTLSPPPDRTGVLVSTDTFTDFRFSLEYMVLEDGGELKVLTTCDEQGRPKWEAQAFACRQGWDEPRRTWRRFDADYEDGCIIDEMFYDLDGVALGSPRSVTTSQPERSYPGRIALVGKGVKIRNLKFRPLKKAAPGSPQPFGPGWFGRLGRRE